MGGTSSSESRPAEYNGVKCCICNTDLPAMKDWTHLTQEIHYDRQTHVFFKGSYYRFCDHHNGWQCPACFWKPLHDQQRKEKEEKQRQAEKEKEMRRKREEEELRMKQKEHQAKQEQAKRAKEEMRQKKEKELQKLEAQRKQKEMQEKRDIQCRKKLEEFSKMVKVWSAEEQSNRIERMTTATVITNNSVPDTSVIYHDMEKSDPVDDSDIRTLTELCEEGIFLFSKGNLLRLLQLAVQGDTDAESMLFHQALDNSTDVLVVFKECLFHDWSKPIIISDSMVYMGNTRESALNGEEESTINRPSLRVLKWIHIFLFDMLSTCLDDDEHSDTETEYDDLFWHTNITNSWCSIQDSVNDWDEALKLAQALFLLIAENQFLGDSVLLETFHFWQEDKCQLYESRNVQFLEKLIRCADSVTQTSSPCVWTKCAAELLINICVPETIGKFPYRRAFANLVFIGVWFPGDMVDTLPHILKNYDPSDCYLPRILEYIVAFKVPCVKSLEKYESVISMFEDGLDSSKILHNIKKEMANETKKSVSEILEEIVENEWAPFANLTSVENIVQNGMYELPKYGYPNLLTDWQVSKFTKWAETLHNHQNQPLSDNILQQSLVVLCCAVRHVKGYWPRETQLVSWCLLMTRNRNKGRLIQILTGEGKSCVIAMAAATLSCLGNNVDIVTSSPVLAARDADDWSSFYRVFSITSTHNTANSADKERSNCYRSTIVYGTVGCFASDILRQEFQLKDVRGRRSFDVVIVDEVDFMLLDQGIQFTYLSESYAGLRHMQPCLALVWNAVTQYKPVATIDGNIFYTGPVRPFYNAVFDVISSGGGDIETYVQLLAMGESEGIFDQGFTDRIQDSEKSLDTLKQVLESVSEETVVDFLNRITDYVPFVFHPYKLNNDGIMVPITNFDDNYDGVSEVPILLSENGMCIVLHDDEVFLKRMIIDNINTHFIQYSV